MRQIIALAAIAFLVAACQPQGPPADRCAGYGFQPGTVDYADCNMRMDMQRRQMLQQMLMRR